MRQLLCAVLVLVCMGLPALGADPAPKLSVEISANKEVKFTTLASVLSAVPKNQGVPAQVSLRVDKATGISAQIRVSPEMPYRDLAGLLKALNKAGVDTITLGVK